MELTTDDLYILWGVCIVLGFLAGWGFADILKTIWGLLVNKKVK